jgi:hypothetical protein
VAAVKQLCTQNEVIEMHNGSDINMERKRKEFGGSLGVLGVLGVQPGFQGDQFRDRHFSDFSPLASFSQPPFRALFGAVHVDEDPFKLKV